MDENVDPVYINQLRRRSPYTLNAAMSIGETIEELILIAECSLEAEYQDQIVHLPIP